MARVGRHSIPRVVWGEPRALSGACRDSLIAYKILVHIVLSSKLH